MMARIYFQLGQVKKKSALSSGGSDLFASDEVIEQRRKEKEKAEQEKKEKEDREKREKEKREKEKREAEERKKKEEEQRKLKEEANQAKDDTVFDDDDLFGTSAPKPSNPAPSSLTKAETAEKVAKSIGLDQASVSKDFSLETDEMPSFDSFGDASELFGEEPSKDDRERQEKEKAETQRKKQEEARREEQRRQKEKEEAERKERLFREAAEEAAAEAARSQKNRRRT